MSKQPSASCRYVYVATAGTSARAQRSVVRKGPGRARRGATVVGWTNDGDALMAGRLLFAIEGVRERWAHACGATEHHTPYNVDPANGPALLWVKDHSTYLMSNGVPGEPIGANATYAEGFGADASRSDVSDVCGEDDFIEAISGDAVETLLRAAKEHNARFMYVDVRDGEIEIGVSI